MSRFAVLAVVLLLWRGAFSEGGPVREPEPMSPDIREIVWPPDSKRLAVPDRASGGAGARWYVYDLEGGGRKPLWPDAAEIAQVSFGDDGAGGGGGRTREGFVLVRRDVGGRDTRLLASPGRMSHPVLRSGRVPCIVDQRLGRDRGG